MRRAARVVRDARLSVQALSTTRRGFRARSYVLPRTALSPAVRCHGVPTGAAVSANMKLRFASSAAETSDRSALRKSSAALHEAFFGADATARISAEAGAVADEAAVKARMSRELEASEGLEVLLLGEALKAEGGRQSISVPASDTARSVDVVTPSVEDISRLLDQRRSENFRVEKPEVLLETLEKFYQEKLLQKRADHIGLRAAWSSQSVADSHVEFTEVAAVVGQLLASYRAALACGGHVETDNKDFQFEVIRRGDKLDCLVVASDDHALAGLRDAVQALLHGYRVLMIVEPQLFPHFKEIQEDLAEAGLPQGIFDVLPGASDENSELLHEALRTVDKLQFSGSKDAFTKLVSKAFEQGNLRLQYAGQVAGPYTGAAAQPLGHCVSAASVDASAISGAIEDDASCIYIAAGGCSALSSSKTGCKHPESAFGAMKSHSTQAFGDHFGVGSVQSLLSNMKRRGSSWRDQEEVRAQYELTEVAEMLSEFLNARDQTVFPQDVSNFLELCAAMEPAATAPYNGADGSSKLVTLKALKATRKNLLIPKGVGLPEDIIKVALLWEMSPFRELPVDLHLMDEKREGKLRITDPLKSFLRVCERTLKWRIHFHASEAEMADWLRASEHPPHFFCVKDRHVLPLSVLQAAAEKGGFFHEGLPDDALGLFNMMTTTQAWTVACSEAQTGEAADALKEAWKETCLREEPHEEPELIQPSKRDMDIGGGFNAGMDPNDDQDWAELSSDDSSDSEDDEDSAKASDNNASPASEASKSTADAKVDAAAKDDTEGKKAA